MTKNLLLALACFCVFTSCWLNGKPNSYNNRTKVLGYKPVYSNDTSLLKVFTDSPHPIKNAGKIYVFGNLILQNEIGSGIHVIDRTVPAQIKNLGFINILGNTELSIKGNYLYANSFSDLVIVDISNWRSATIVKRIKNAFAIGNEIAHNLTIPPPEHNVSYECINPSLGIHTGWTKDSVDSYTCFYQ